MRPVRMCMVCRKRKEKQELIRIARLRDAAPYIDSDGKGQGRGMYLCRSADCIGQAQKRRVVERALSCKAEPKLYEQLLRMTEEKRPT